MNKILALSFLLLLGFLAWREKATLLEWKDEAMSRFGKTVPSDAETAGDGTNPEHSNTNRPSTGPGKSTAATPSSTKKSPPVAEILPDPPEGIYYLRARVSVKTDSGVRGYAAGTKLTKTGENLGMAVVTDGSNTFSVEYGQLTRKMSEVVEIQSKAAVATAKIPATQLAATKPPAPTSAVAPGPPADPGKFARESERRSLLAQLESFDRQIYPLNDQISNAKGKQAMARARGRSSSASIGVADLQKKLDQLLADRAKINSRLEALPP